MTDARILDRGYRRYEGPRLGPMSALRSITIHTLRRILGLRRPARAKVLPVIVILIAYLPAIVIVGIASFAKFAVNELPSYAGYFGTVFTSVLLFVTFVAPEALCPDRRTKLIGQYLAGPVSRAGYLAAKVVAVMSVLLLVTLGPQLLMLVALALEGAGPDGIDGFMSTLGRIVASGVAVSAMLTVLALAVSSFTDRKAFASVGFIVFMTITSIAAGIAYEDGEGRPWAALLSLTALPVELAFRIFGVPAHCTTSFRDSECDELLFPDVSTAAVVGAVVVWTALAAVVLWWRYRKVEVA